MKKYCNLQYGNLHRQKTINETEYSFNNGKRI